MPRTSRVVISDYPHHVIQRGHNRQTVFPSDDDYQYYLDLLMRLKRRSKGVWNVEVGEGQGKQKNKSVPFSSKNKSVPFSSLFVNKLET
jgi:REP element-mobilizing transposase RayT